MSTGYIGFRSGCLTADSDASRHVFWLTGILGTECNQVL